MWGQEGMVMPRRVLIMSALVYLGYMILLPFVITDRHSLIIAWLVMTFWFVVYFSFRVRGRRKELK